MRIVIDMQGAQSASRFSGIGRYTMDFTRAILRHSSEHEIILVLSGLLPGTIEPIRSAFYGQLSQEKILVWYAPGPVSECEPRNEKRRERAELIRESFIASLQPDVVLISSFLQGYLDDAVTSIGKFDSTTPVSLIHYDLIPLLNPDQFLNPSSRQLYRRHYLRKLESQKRAALHFAISDFTRQEAIDNLGLSNTEVISIGAAVGDHFKQITQSPEFYEQLRIKHGITGRFILNTGGSDRHKNLPRLIEAYAELSEDLRNQYQLVLVGNVPDELKQTAIKAGLVNNELVYTGYVTDDELVHLYSYCDIYVFASWHEGFGLPALEAMACGAPVIGANTTSLPEVIGLDEALFDPFSVKAISRKLTQVLQDVDLRDRLRNHGALQVKKFSWDRTAKIAFDAWKQLYSTKQSSPQGASDLSSKRRLAYVSPLPPDKTGIANYSSDLLPYLAKYYQITVIVDKKIIDNDWQIKNNIEVQDKDWFRQNKDLFDRVLYHIGNSPFHQYMILLLQEIQGTVVLHDFYLNHLMNYQQDSSGTAYSWISSMYSAHGYEALQDQYQNSFEALNKYPCNADVIKYAQGVIVHSNHSRKLAESWYNNELSSDWKVIPHLGEKINLKDRQVVRDQLGYNKQDFVVCSFGFIDPAKLNHRLLDCWFKSALAKNRNCHLVFVGENHGGEYGSEMITRITTSEFGARIKITGYTTTEKFQDYLLSSDLAVQLRTSTRGETSGAVLQCMSYGLPLIVNEHGTLAELPQDLVCMLPDNFKDTEMVNALETLWQSPDLRLQIGDKLVDHVRRYHSAEICAKLYNEAIEAFSLSTRNAPSTLISSLKRRVEPNLSDSGLMNLASAISRNHPLNKVSKNIFLDVTASRSNKLQTGIERVAQSITIALLNSPPKGYRVEPVYLSNCEGNWFYRYARIHTSRLLKCPVEDFVDDPVELQNGDLLLCLDLSSEIIHAAESGLYENFRDQGVKVYATVFDLLPIQMPEYFPPNADLWHRVWLESISKFDGALCISESVANDLNAWLEQNKTKLDNRLPYSIGWFHLGSDIVNSSPTSGIPPNANSLLNNIKKRPSFLMVGTIEPRKGYDQVLDVFDELWKQGVEANLVIVGREGWKHLNDESRRNIPEIIKRLRNNLELGSRLFWLDGASDEFLEIVYQASSCLIAASLGEGYGLPIVEAIRHNLPVIARDLKVFREVVSNKALFFDDTANDKSLIRVIKEFVVKKQKNSEVTMEKRHTLNTWKDSANKLLDNLINHNWLYKT